MPKAFGADMYSGMQPREPAQLSLCATTSLASDISAQPYVDKFIARQPIFDRQQQVYGYELLFRSGQVNAFDGRDPDRATASVIVDSLFLHGLETLTNHRRAFINCTREMLVDDYTGLLPKDITVVEILETVEPDAEVLAACRRLKERGYCLALDDVSSSERLTAFVDLVAFVKVDLPTTTPEQRREMARLCAHHRIAALAEKVETHDDFCQAQAMGYHYFQGYFFSKPQIMSGRDIPAFKLNYFRILQAVQRPKVELEEIEAIVKTEQSLCFRLLRYLNSPFFGFRNGIHSIRHALTLLGARPIKLWTSLVVLATMCQDKPSELAVTCLTRAVFCESLAAGIGMRGQEAELFLLGLLSLIDAILDRPMPEILSQLAVAEEIKLALLHGSGRFGNVLSMVQAYEQGDWTNFQELAATFRVDETNIPDLYLKAVEWAHQTFQHC